MLLSALITILVFAFTISLLVFIHEGGHFLVAKWFRVWVHEFAIGFGPAVWRRRWGETEYAIRVLPLGGFVRLAGEDGGSEEDEHVPSERLFTAKPPGVRTAIILAGPLMNILAAVVLMIAYVGIFGVPFVEIVEVTAGSPAQGILQSGDRILRIAGEKIYFTGQVQGLVQRFQGHPLEVTVGRGKEQLTITVTPYLDESSGRYLIGLLLREGQRRPHGIGESVSIGLKRVGNTLTLLYLGIKQVITGQTSAGEAFRGPVGIANLLGWSLTQGIEYFFRLVALLSLVLGIFNLLPFPALDGGRILFIFVGALAQLIFNRPIPAKWEGWVHYIGFIILMGIVLLITWQDIQRLFRGDL